MYKSVIISLKEEEHQILVDALCARVIYLQGIHHRQRGYPQSETRDEKILKIEIELQKTKGALLAAQQATGLFPSKHLLQSQYKNEDQPLTAGQRRRKPTT